MNQYLEDLNYSRDFRVTNAERYNRPIPDHVPTKWILCPTCEGKGTHVNPSIDASGLTAEDFHDDPDFAYDYKSGMYDITCQTCHGRTTVRIVDTLRLNPASHCSTCGMAYEADEEGVYCINCEDYVE